MDDLIQQEIDLILADPDYDQSKLQTWFQSRYGDGWRSAWHRYMETGEITKWTR